MKNLSKRKLFNLIVVTILMVTILMVSNACFEKKDSYKVTLMDGTTILREIDVDKDSRLEMPDGVTKAGYTFEGWFTDEDCTVPYEPNLLSANLTLYAKYTKESIYIAFNLKGGAFSSGINRVEVKTGESYVITEVPTLTGKVFDCWLTPDLEEFPASGVFAGTETIRITAKWRNYQATFVDKDGNELEIREANDSAKITSKWNEPDAGYEVVGYYADSEMQTAFNFNNALTADTTVYVKIAPKTFTIFVNGGESTTAVFNEDYTLTIPEKAGYTFVNFTYNGQEFSPTGTYTWTENIIVVANFERDENYYKAAVSFFDGQKQILSELEVDGGDELKVADLPTAPNKAGYEFDGWYTDSTLQTAFADRVVADKEDISLYAKYTAKNFDITLNLDGGSVAGDTTISVTFDSEYELPVPTKDGYEFVGYIYENEEFALSGVYVIAEDIEVTADWKEVCLDGEEGDSLFISVDKKYFKERDDKSEDFTLVFLSNTSYDLSALGAVTFDGANFTVADSKFTTGEVSDNFKFIIEITDKNGAKHTLERDARVVENVSAFTVGTNYISAWLADRTKTFIDAKETDIMLVGANDFRLDVNILGKGNKALSFDAANVEVVVKDNGSVVTDYAYENGVITFNSSLVGKTLTVSLKPKYYVADGVEFTVTVNNGVNIYDNATLRQKYADHSVSEINILRNITAEISAEDYVGSSMTPKNTYQNGVYTRIGTSKTDVVTVNGNFFKIDGKGLKLGDNGVDGRDWSIDGNTGYYVNNMQIGIFLYSCSEVNDNSSTGFTDGSYNHKGQAFFNNLLIEGNFDGPYNSVRPYNGKELLIYSGAYRGIVVRGGTVKVDNTTILNTGIAIFTDAGEYIHDDATQQPTQVTLDCVKIDKSWSNHIYMYNPVKMTIVNSKIGSYNEQLVASSCGGAAIQIDDKANASIIESEVIIEGSTEIINFATGEEPWFVAFGMAIPAAGVKTQVKGGIIDATNLLNAGLALQENPFRFPSTTVVKQGVSNEERINLVILVRDCEEDAANWVEDAAGHATVVTNFPVYFDAVKAAMYSQGVQVDPAEILNTNYIPGIYSGQVSAFFASSVPGVGYVEGYVEAMLTE